MDESKVKQLIDAYDLLGIGIYKPRSISMPIKKEKESGKNTEQMPIFGNQMPIFDITTRGSSSTDICDTTEYNSDRKSSTERNLNLLKVLVGDEVEKYKASNARKARWFLDPLMSKDNTNSVQRSSTGGIGPLICDSLKEYQTIVNKMNARRSNALDCLDTYNKNKPPSEICESLKEYQTIVNKMNARRSNARDRLDTGNNNIEPPSEICESLKEFTTIVENINTRMLNKQTENLEIKNRARHQVKANWFLAPHVYQAPRVNNHDLRFKVNESKSTLANQTDESDANNESCDDKTSEITLVDTTGEKFEDSYVASDIERHSLHSAVDTTGEKFEDRSVASEIERHSLHSSESCDDKESESILVDTPGEKFEESYVASDIERHSLHSAESCDDKERHSLHSAESCDDKESESILVDTPGEKFEESSVASDLERHSLHSAESCDDKESESILVDTPGEKFEESCVESDIERHSMHSAADTTEEKYSLHSADYMSFDENYVESLTDSIEGVYSATDINYRNYIRQKNLKNRCNESCDDKTSESTLVDTPGEKFEESSVASDIERHSLHSAAYDIERHSLHSSAQTTGEKFKESCVVSDIERHSLHSAEKPVYNDEKYPKSTTFNDTEIQNVDELTQEKSKKNKKRRDKKTTKGKRIEDFDKTTTGGKRMPQIEDFMKKTKKGKIMPRIRDLKKGIWDRVRGVLGFGCIRKM